MVTVVYSKLFVIMRQRGRTLKTNRVRPRSHGDDLCVVGAPAGLVRLTGYRGVRYRGGDCANGFLFVRFDRELLGATAGFAPGDGQFRTFWDVSVDGCQG